jgi:hypothetical protein
MTSTDSSSVSSSNFASRPESPCLPCQQEIPMSQPECAPCAEPVPEPSCGTEGPAINEVCTPKWDYVTKQQVHYKQVPYQAEVKGCKTIMVDKTVPDIKYVTKTKQVPCTVKKMVKSTEPYTKTIMKPVQVPDTKLVSQQVEVPCTKTVQYSKQVPDTKCVEKKFKVPCTKTVMKKFPVQTTKCVNKMVTVESTKEVQEQVKVPCSKTIQVPEQVCETKYVTQYKTVSYKKPYEARIYKEACKLPEPACPVSEENSCAVQCVPTSCAPCEQPEQATCGYNGSSSSSSCGAC